MRGQRLVAVRCLARNDMLHERNDVAGGKRRKIECLCLKAMSQKASREPQHVLDGPWTEAALPQKVERQIS